MTFTTRLRVGAAILAAGAVLTAAAPARAQTSSTDPAPPARLTDLKARADQSVKDVSQEIEYRLSERESQAIADIDQALLRIEEGTYGVCARCGKEIPERRLEAMPTARYDADCQSISDGSRVLQRTPLSISRPGTRRTRNDSDRCTITAENLLHGCSEWWSLSDNRRRSELESDH